MNIFVLDDEHDIVAMLADMLEPAGHTVRGFTDPAGLLAALMPVTDLVITDVNMPAMDGFAVAAAVAEKVGHAPPRTLLISAAQHDDRVKAASCKEVLGILGKPFRLHEFNAVIEVLRQSRSSCPCRIKGLIACPETRAAAEAANPEKCAVCRTPGYADCPDYANDCGERLRGWIAGER